jgi:golgin subfamily B member 1
MNIDFINSLENQINTSFQVAGSKLSANSHNLKIKKDELNGKTEELLTDINGLLSELDNKYVKIKQLETENSNNDKLDILIKTLEHKNNNNNNNEKQELESMRKQIIQERKQLEKDKNKLNRNKDLVDKVNDANQNNKKIEQLDILIDKNNELKQESKLDKILLIKVINDMKKIIELVPEDIEDDELRNNVLEIIKGGRYDEQYDKLPDKLDRFSNKYKKILHNKSKLKTYVNNICTKYTNTNECINIIFETLETINLNEQQIKKLDVNLSHIRNNNVKLLQEKDVKISQLNQSINKQNELLEKINTKLHNNLEKYKQSHKKYLDIEADVNKSYKSTGNNADIDKVLIQYDSVNKGLLAKLDELSTQNVELEIEKNNIVAKIDEDKDSVIRLQTEVNDLKNQLEIIQESNKKRIDEMMSKLDAIKKEKDELISDISKLESKIKELEELKKNVSDDDTNERIAKYRLHLKKYRNMLDDAHKWEAKINNQLLDIKSNLQEKIKNFDEVELILKNIKQIDIKQIKNYAEHNINSKQLRFKIKDLTNQVEHLNNTKLNNEQKLEELNELINKDDLTIQETRQKLKEYRDEIVDNLNKK